MSKFPLLNMIIHALHILWLSVFWMNSNPEVGLHINAALVAIWIAAYFLEAVRWHIVGREVKEVTGAYSYASAVDTANQRFLNFTWYVLRLAPKFSLVEKTSEKLFKESRVIELRQAFVDFWLNQELRHLTVFGILPILIWIIVDGSPITIGGLLRSGGVSIFVWFFSLAMIGKILSIYSYVVFFLITKEASNGNR